MLYLRGRIWWSRITVCGKYVYFSTKMTSKKDAKKWEEEKIASLRGEDSAKRAYQKIQEHLVSKTMNFEEAFAFFSNYPREKMPGKRTAQLHQSYWNDFASFAAARGIAVVANVTEECAAEYIRRLQTVGRFVGEKTMPLSPESVELRKVVLRLIFSILVKGGSAIENPFQNIQTRSARAEVREVFTPEELRKLGAFPEHPVFPILITGCFTGLRLSDICHLKWDNYDPRKRFLSGTQQKTGQPYSIPVLDPLFHFLNRLEEQRTPGKYIFPHLAELYDRNPAIISKQFKELLVKAGIENATVEVPGRERKVSVKDIHSLRHTFAYIAGMSHIPLAVVQSLLGHMTPAITRHYMAHATEEDKRRYLQNMPDFLTRDTQPKRILTHARVARLLSRVTPDNLDRVKRRLLRILE